MQLEELVLPLRADSSKFNAALKAVTAGVGAAVAAMGVAVKASFDWAGELDALQDVMGNTNKEAAALNFVLRKSGTDTGTAVKGWEILQKGLIKFDGSLDTTGKALKNWGIDVMDANGSLKDQTVLIGDISDKYNGFATAQERVNFLTEVFGKSGAGMIDFFDTLAAEGGIDTVTKKVESLGLAIDPGRYEQFNRNLEEMKLVGLGLAVGFTEQLMPAFEGISEWALTEGIPALKTFGTEIQTAFDEGGLLGVADLLLGEIEDVDWSTVSTAIIDGVNGIDWSQAGIDFSGFVSRVAETIGQELREFDWLGVGNSMASGLNNFIAGALFGTDEAGLQTLVQTKLGEIETEFAKFSEDIPGSLQSMDANIQAPVRTAMTNLANTVIQKLGESEVQFAIWQGANLTSIGKWGVGVAAEATKGMTKLKENIDTKLSAISEEWQRRAGAWLQKAADSITGQKGTLLGAIQTIVDEINNILKKIRTSFNISFSFGTGSMGASNTTSIPGGGSGGSGNITGTSGRASGGPVIAGQGYRVFDTPFDEMFFPSRNGRVDPIRGGGREIIDIGNWSDFDYARLASEVVKAQNNT